MIWTRAQIAESANIHPTAVIGSQPQHRAWYAKGEDKWEPAIVGRDARIGPLCVVDGGTEDPTVIGADAFLMSQCHVGHDAQIGDGCELAPGVIVGGHAVLGDFVRVGMGAIFKPFVKVGNDARIGAGAVVIGDVPAGEVWAGVPARIIHEKHLDNPLRASGTYDPLHARQTIDWNEVVEDYAR